MCFVVYQLIAWHYLLLRSTAVRASDRGVSAKQWHVNVAVDDDFAIKLQQHAHK